MHFLLCSLLRSVIVLQTSCFFSDTFFRSHQNCHLVFATDKFERKINISYCIFYITAPSLMVTVIVKSHPATFLTQYSAHPSDYLRYHQKNKIWATLFLLARTVYFYKSQLNLIIKIWRGDIRHRLISEWIFTGVSQTKMIDAFSSVQSIKVSDCFANKLFLFRHVFRGSPTLRSNASVKHGSLSQDYNF